MGSGKGRNGSGTPSSSFAGVSSDSPLSSARTSKTQRQPQLQQDKRQAEGGWPARVKVLASSTLGIADRDEGGYADTAGAILADT